MRATSWLSSLWEALKNFETDCDPVERLELRVAALERAMAAASMTTSHDQPMPQTPLSGISSLSGRN